jgi:hypothetical protein
VTGISLGVLSIDVYWLPVSVWLNQPDRILVAVLDQHGED